MAAPGRQDGRPQAIRVTVVLMLAACIAVNPSLWTAQREYPPAPWLPLARLPAALDALAVPALLTLLGLALLPRPWAPWPFLGLAALLVLGDQARLQPWLYQGALFLGALALARDPRRAAQLVLALSYFWSGVSKMNPDFGPMALPWLLGALRVDAASAVPTGWLLALGLAFGAIEALIGVALLLPATRRVGMVAAVAMHLLVLAAIGPAGLGWNHVVWPWNLALIALVVILFRGDVSQPRAILWARGWYPKLLVLLVGLMPALHQVGLWDAYLSFSLYSNNVDEAWLVADARAAARLGPAARAVADVRPGGTHGVRFLSWAMREVGVPAYPERRAHLAVFRALCRQAPDPSGLHLLIVPRHPGWRARPAPEVHSCRGPVPKLLGYTFPWLSM